MKLIHLLPLVGLIELGTAIGFDELAVMKCYPQKPDERLYRGYKDPFATNNNKKNTGLMPADCLSSCWCSPGEASNTGLICKDTPSKPPPLGNGVVTDAKSMTYLCAAADGGNCRCSIAGKADSKQTKYRRRADPGVPDVPYGPRGASAARAE